MFSHPVSSEAVDFAIFQRNKHDMQCENGIKL